jgi:hypothetical protein
MLESLTFRRRIGVLVVAAIAGIARIGTVTVLQTRGLVGDAGTTMNEIVTTVQRVTDLIAEISAAAGEVLDAHGDPCVCNAVAGQGLVAQLLPQQGPFPPTAVSSIPGVASSG